MYNSKNNKKGFTLIELLVVVAIIGLVSSIVLVSLSTTRKRANATAATQGVKELQKAIELYALNNNGTYPNGIVGQWVVGQCDATNGCDATFNALLNTLKTNKYLSQSPNFYLNALSTYPYESVIQYNNYQGTGNLADACGGIVAKNYYIYISSQTPLNLPKWTEDGAGDPTDYCVGG